MNNKKKMYGSLKIYFHYTLITQLKPEALLHLQAFTNMPHVTNQYQYNKKHI